MLSVAPMVLPFFAVLAVLVPSFLALLWPEYDHCLQHDDQHLHLCLLHLPSHVGNATSWLALMLVALWTSARMGRALVELCRASRSASALRAHGKPDPVLGTTVLPTATPLCLLVGIFRPTLFLSEGLLAGVSEPELAVILHHERAHGARSDVLLRLVARAATVFMWPSARSRLLGALELAAEQSCDEVAAYAVGDRLQVAEAILKVERLLQVVAGRIEPLAIAFGGETVPQRVTALLEAPRRAGNVAALALGFALILCGVLALSSPLHHLTESLLEALTH
jgi:Zn-dependent protease with chaperone function